MMAAVRSVVVLFSFVVRARRKQKSGDENDASYYDYD